MNFDDLPPAWRTQLAIDGSAEEPCVWLTGEWVMRGGMPRYATIAAQFEQARHVHLGARDLQKWDSSAVNFLVGVVRDCRARKVEVDESALPDGLRRMLTLAFAVPPPPARATVPAPGLLASVGQGVLQAWRDWPAMVEFAGEILLSFGRFVTGRARYRRQDFAYLIEEVGPRALPIVSLISFLVGTILAYMGAVQLALFGAAFISPIWSASVWCAKWRPS